MFTIIGFILLGVIIVTIRSELNFISQNKKLRAQNILSVLSICILVYLMLVLLLHWSLSPLTVIFTTMFLVPLLLILAPLILWLRSRAFKGLMLERKDEQMKLVIEVQDILDEQKRIKIKQGKIDRGESVD